MATQKITLNINSEYFDTINNLLGQGNEAEQMEHFKNALELYAVTLEGISNNRLPVLFDEKSKDAYLVPLPPILALLQYRKELEKNEKVSINILHKKTMESL